MERINHTIGILAPVDAGKTTLSEGLLFLTGSIRKAGRVDHGDAFLDTEALEKERGITIFSKQAGFTVDGQAFTLLDTPGHADFSPEMERTLQVLDAAVLVISAADGVTGQVRVLWSLLSHYGIPTLIFVNKMDQPGTDREKLLAALRKQLSPHVVDCTNQGAAWQEEVALCREELLEAYLAGTEVTREDAAKLAAARELFPCYFGAALKQEGMDALLDGLICYVPVPHYGTQFAARVFKITRDNGIRLTWMKITGGILKAREQLLQVKEGQEIREKVDQIRIYSGSRFENVPEAAVGMICAVTGLTATFAGQGLGVEKTGSTELLQPILNCRVLMTDDMDPFVVWQKLRLLEEEEPMLHVTRQEQTGEIHVQVMGQVQMEILRYEMEQRFQLPIGFGPAVIVYKETIAAPVEGMGHFEPLRHYAEVHLLMEPAEPGSGLLFDSICPTDLLDRNWQKLILSCLEEKKHIGVLTGAELTDVKITLVTGKASIKHTEGGDFREAACRAVRQGLMMAENVLLEPVCSFRLEIPQDAVGRALTDLQRMEAQTQPPEIGNGTAVLQGSVPAAALGDYATQVSAYTRGEGHLTTSLKDYEPCSHPEEIIAASHYDPDLDQDNPSSSVFCSHGVGTIFSWDQVQPLMHVESGLKLNHPEGETKADRLAVLPDPRSFREKERDARATEAELQAIFERTYGPVRVRTQAQMGTRSYGAAPERSSDGHAADNSADDSAGRVHRSRSAEGREQEYLLVDGYNILYASDELKALAAVDLKAARDKLMDILSNFQGYRREKVILVFDAYRVEGGQERVYLYHNLSVVYTREAETADQYIEKAAHEIQKKYRVSVATSDAVEQVIVFGSGAMRLSARDFWEQVHLTEEEIRSRHLQKIPERLHHYVLHDTPDGI